MTAFFSACMYVCMCLFNLHQTLTLQLPSHSLPISVSFTDYVKTVKCLCVWAHSRTLKLDGSDINTQQQPCIQWQLVYPALIPTSFLMHKSDGLQCSRSLSSSAACIFGYFSLPSVLGPSRPSIIHEGFEMAGRRCCHIFAPCTVLWCFMQK